MAMSKIKIPVKEKQETYFDVFYKEYPQKCIDKDTIARYFCVKQMEMSKDCPFWYCKNILDCYDCWNAPKGTWDNPYRKEI